MKKIALCILLTASATASAEGQFYAGTGLDFISTDITENDFFSQSDIQAGVIGVETEEDSIFPSIYGGLKLNDNFSVEAGAKLHGYSFKSIDGNKKEDIEVEFATLSLTLAPVVNYALTDKLNVYASAGLHYWTTETVITTTSRIIKSGEVFESEKEKDKTKSGADLYASIGAGYEIYDNLELKLVASRLGSTIKSNGSNNLNANYTSVSLGAALHF